ncbi:hypothetical protein Tco_0522423 [Tanacetum coccineum]
MEEEEEDPKMEEEEEEMDVDADEERYGPEWILPYEGADPFNPLPPGSDSEYKIEEAAPMPSPPIPADHEPEIWIGSSYSAAAGRDPEDLTLSHIRSDLNALHRRVRQIEEDDVRAENNRLRMMLDCSEDCIRATRRDLDRVTWHHRHLSAALEVEQARQVHVGGQGGNANGSGGQGEAPAVRECTFAGFMKCNPMVFHRNEGAVELCQWFENIEMVFRIKEWAEERKVKFTAATLQGRALTWWNSQVVTRGLEAANRITWT